MDALKRIFNRPSGAFVAPGVIDHVPVGTQTNEELHRDRLKQAAERYGRPFKCAGPDLPHEVLARTDLRAPQSRTAEAAANTCAAPKQNHAQAGARARRLLGRFAMPRARARWG